MPRVSFSGRRVDLSVVAPVIPPAPAGAAPVTVDDFKSTGVQRGSGLAWQAEAFLLSELVGEIGFLSSLKAATIAACEFRLERRVGGQVVELVDPRPVRVWDSFVGPSGGRDDLLRRAVLNRDIAGEVWLLGTPTVEGGAAGDSPGLLWEFVSCVELRVDSRGVVRNDGVSGTRKVSGDTYVSRWWESDPQFSGLAWCALKRALPVARRLAVLDQVVEAQSKSRLSAGALLVPEAMVLAAEGEFDDGVEGVDEGGVPALVQEMFEHMNTPVTDRGAPSSLVPLLLRGDAEDLAAVRLIELGRDPGDWAGPLREEEVGRLARVLDVPPEILAGKGSLNHWSAYSVDGEFVSKFVIPLGKSLAEFLTSAFLRPMLVAFEGMSVVEAAEFSIVFDPSPVVARADAGKMALELWKQRLISRDAVVRHVGFDEGDLLDDREWAEELLRDAVQADSGLIGVLVDSIPGLGDALKDDLPYRPSAPPVGAGGDDDTPDSLLPSDPESGGGEPERPDGDEGLVLLASDFLLRVERLRGQFEGGRDELLTAVSVAFLDSVENWLQRSRGMSVSSVNDFGWAERVWRARDLVAASVVDGGVSVPGVVAVLKEHDVASV